MPGDLFGHFGPGLAVISLHPLPDIVEEEGEVQEVLSGNRRVDFSDRPRFIQKALRLLDGPEAVLVGGIKMGPALLYQSVDERKLRNDLPEDMGPMHHPQRLGDPSRLGENLPEEEERFRRERGLFRLLRDLRENFQKGIGDPGGMFLCQEKEAKDLFVPLEKLKGIGMLDRQLPEAEPKAGEDLSRFPRAVPAVPAA